jgi:hypothetical protein
MVPLREVFWQYGGFFAAIRFLMEATTRFHEYVSVRMVTKYLLFGGNEIWILS